MFRTLSREKKAFLLHMLLSPLNTERKKQDLITIYDSILVASGTLVSWIYESVRFQYLFTCFLSLSLLWKTRLIIKNVVYSKHDCSDFLKHLEENIATPPLAAPNSTTALLSLLLLHLPALPMPCNSLILLFSLLIMLLSTRVMILNLPGCFQVRLWISWICYCCS